MEPDTLFPMPQTARTSDDYWTPKWVFDALGIEFDLDVACPPEGPAHTPCRAYYTQETNGLTSPWHGTVWMNPPYSNTTPWVHKFIAHANGIALLPDINRTWRTTIFNAADAVIALPAQMKFDVPDERRGDIRYSTMLYGMGTQAVIAMNNANIGRVR
jgi:hypothetical protein